MPTQEKKLILKAINDLGRKVSIADVATQTGLPLSATTIELNKVASETGGHLLVSTTGDIAYNFDLGFENSYITHGIRRFFGTVADKAFHIAFLILRISFGIMLILSLVTIVIIIGLIMLSLNRDNDRDDGGGFDFDLFDFMILQDLFRWNTYYSYDAYSNHQNAQRPTIRTNSKSNFLFNCFSFLFGDGNPNAHLEERRWQLIGQSINNHGGVMTCEQLAPYTDSDPKNEDAVLPVLVRFDGRPEVSDSGNIIYVFPSLSASALAADAHTDAALPDFLNEWTWKFSNLSDDALVPVAVLAAINLIGSWWLLFEMAHIPILIRIAPLILLLATYGTLFVAIPLLRLLTIKVLNERISTRNIQRSRWSQQLKQPIAELKKKLDESRQFVVKKRLISDNDVIYRTDEDLLTQEFEK